MAPWPVRKPSASASEQPGGDASLGAPSAGAEGVDQRTQAEQEEPGPADEVGEAPTEYTFGGGDDEEAIELGELSDLGRAKPGLPSQAEREAKAKAEAALPGADLGTQPAPVDTTGMGHLTLTLTLPLPLPYPYPYPYPYPTRRHGRHRRDDGGVGLGLV